MSVFEASGSFRLGLIFRFCCVEQRGVFLHPPGWDAIVHRRVILSIKFLGTHLYSWVERGNVRVSVLPNNTIIPVKARIQTDASRQLCKPQGHHTVDGEQ